MSYDFRAYLKPNGSNPEINSAYYELASQEKIQGVSNCEVLTLGFRRGEFSTKLCFRPVDPTKPIVFAIDGVTYGCYFVVVDGHIGGMRKSGGMFNYKPFQTDKYIIDCYDGSSFGTGKKNHWSITSEGTTFVYGDVAFPDTWQLRECDFLCAFVGGELTVNQLRMHAYISNCEAVKENRREEHIKRLSLELREATSRASVARDDLSCAMDRYICITNRYTRLVDKLKSTMNSFFPFVSKDDILKFIEDK